MTGRGCGERPGCGSRFCRSAHAALRRLPVRRYPAGTGAVPDLTGTPSSGWVCGLLSPKSMPDGVPALPGHSGGERPMWLIAAAGSLEPTVATGDRIDISGAVWRVCSTVRGELLTAELIAES